MLQEAALCLCHSAFAQPAMCFLLTGLPKNLNNHPDGNRKCDFKRRTVRVDLHPYRRPSTDEIATNIAAQTETSDDGWEAISSGTEYPTTIRLIHTKVRVPRITTKADGGGIERKILASCAHGSVSLEAAIAARAFT